MGSLDHRWDATYALGGQRALELLDGGDYAAVITDLDMPHVDGFHVLEAAQRQCPDAIRIVLTGRPHATVGSAAHLVMSKLELHVLPVVLERALLVLPG